MVRYGRPWFGPVGGGVVAGVVGASAASGGAALLLSFGESDGEDPEGRRKARTPVPVPSASFDGTYDCASGSLTLTARSGTFDERNTERLVLHAGTRRRSWSLPVGPGDTRTVPVAVGETVDVVWYGPGGRTETVDSFDPSELVDGVRPYPVFEATHDPEQRRLPFTHAGGAVLDASGAKLQVRVSPDYGRGQSEQRGTLASPVTRGDTVTVEARRGDRANLWAVRPDGAGYSIGTYTPGGGWGATPPETDWTFRESGDGKLEVCHAGGESLIERNTLHLSVVVDGQPCQTFLLPTDAGDCRSVRVAPGTRVEVVWLAASFERTDVLASHEVGS